MHRHVPCILVFADERDRILNGRLPPVGLRSIHSPVGSFRLDRWKSGRRLRREEEWRKANYNCLDARLGVPAECRCHPLRGL